MRYLADLYYILTLKTVQRGCPLKGQPRKVKCQVFRRMLILNSLFKSQVTQEVSQYVSLEIGYIVLHSAAGTHRFGL